MVLRAVSALAVISCGIGAWYAWRLAADPLARANPRWAGAWIEEGLRAEMASQLRDAESCFLEAARLDRTWLPRWTLANYYLRRGERDRFWQWARAAASIPYADVSALFPLAWRVSNDSGEILARLIPPSAAVHRQYLEYLLNRDLVTAAEPVAGALAVQATPEDRALLLRHLEREITARRMAPSIAVWNALIQRGLIQHPPLNPERGVSLTNGDFARAPERGGFDWRIHPVEGVAVEYLSPGVRVTLSGRQPERTDILYQFVPLLGDTAYRLQFRCRTETVGLHWSLESDLLPGVDLRSEEWREQSIAFATRQAGLYQLVLRYQRPQGSPRAEGALEMGNLALERARE